MEFCTVTLLEEKIPKPPQLFQTASTESTSTFELLDTIALTVLISLAAWRSTSPRRTTFVRPDTVRVCGRTAATDSDCVGTHKCRPSRAGASPCGKRYQHRQRDC